MTPKERSAEIQKRTEELNRSLAEAADEGLEIWVRSFENKRIEAASVTIVSVSIMKREEA